MLIHSLSAIENSFHSEYTLERSVQWNRTIFDQTLCARNLITRNSTIILSRNLPIRY